MASGLKIKHESSHVTLRIVAACLFTAFCVLAAFYGLRWYNTGETGPLPFPIAAAGPSVDERDVTAQQLTKFKADATHPRYLSIPVLDVAQARILPVGTTQNNLLEMPENIHDAGWYAKSAQPGSGTGAVVLDGRSAGPTQPGAFARAENLQRGDVLSLERGDGKVLNYQVHDVRTMSIEQVAKRGLNEMMYSADEASEGLNIVVSAGKWIPKQQEYDRRIMVRSVRVE